MSLLAADQALMEGVRRRERRALAKAITLLESTRADHRARADALLNALLPHTGQAIRLGISGVPGVGKSTFIEALGLFLIAQGHRVAVLAIDPSSSVSGGSILGDKTRMEQLSVHEAAYIRPSPAAGTLGGVAEKTREALLVCEAAGYDVVIVETVGVGQSETDVANLTDVFVLLKPPEEWKNVHEKSELIARIENAIEPYAEVVAFARDVEKMFARVKELLGTLEHPAMKALGQAYLADQFLMDQFRQCPAAKSAHHAYLGGLLDLELPAGFAAIDVRGARSDDDGCVANADTVFHGEGYYAGGWTVDVPLAHALDCRDFTTSSSITASVTVIVSVSRVWFRR